MKKTRLAVIASAVILVGGALTSYAPIQPLPEPGTTWLFTVVALGALFGLAKMFR